jgi:DNA-binding transcriptional ArsR family regulator
MARRKQSDRAEDSLIPTNGLSSPTNGLSSPTNGLSGVTGVDRTIHEPARLLIVALLSGVEQADFLFLLRETALTKGNLSSHLSKLESAGFVVIEKRFEGKKPLTVVSLTDAGRAAYRDYRRRMETFLRDAQ